MKVLGGVEYMHPLDVQAMLNLESEEEAVALCRKEGWRILEFFNENQEKLIRAEDAIEYFRKSM